MPCGTCSSNIPMAWWHASAIASMSFGPARNIGAARCAKWSWAAMEHLSSGPTPAIRPPWFARCWISWVPAFPTTTNAKGFRVLDPHVRLIQGDGIDFASLGKILEAVKAHGSSADNIAFGSGGGLLQKLNRDTLKFAFKCSSVVVNDEPREVYKRPITDSGKKSKSGRFKLIRLDAAHGATYTTVRENDPGDDVLHLVFENGELVNLTTLAQVRQRAAVKAL